MNYTPEMVNEAYAKLIWALGLMDYVLQAGIELSAGSTISIFSILQDNLKGADEILDSLNNGREEVFSALWKNKEKL